MYVAEAMQPRLYSCNRSPQMFTPCTAVVVRQIQNVLERGMGHDDVHITGDDGSVGANIRCHDVVTSGGLNRSSIEGCWKSDAPKIGVYGKT